MQKSQLYDIALKYLEENCPQLDSELHYENSFQLLVAVVLSAQCTDERVNKVTPKLFEAYPTPFDMAKATEAEIYPFIKSVSYPNNKSKHLVGLANILVNNFQGQVPSEMEDLTTIPGVGRKTANVIQALFFQKAAMPVDTHVFRVSHRLGLVPQSATTPLAVEKILSKNIPVQSLGKSHFWILYHGRYTCIARSPKCVQCGLTEVCSFFRKKQKENK